MLEKCDCYYY